MYASAAVLNGTAPCDRRSSSRAPSLVDWVDAVLDLFARLAGCLAGIGQRHVRMPTEYHVAPLAGNANSQDPAAPAARQNLQRQARDAADEVQARVLAKLGGATFFGYSD
jgi:hypothetical protein